MVTSSADQKPVNVNLHLILEKKQEGKNNMEKK